MRRRLIVSLIVVALLVVALVARRLRIVTPPPPTPAPVSPVSLGSAPEFFRSPQMNCAMIAEAVNHFVALGKRDGLAELRGLASVRNSAGYVDGYDRFGYVCRILFLPRDSEPLREPRFGGLGLPDELTANKDWPLFPVALSGSSYFVLGEGYTLGGFPEYPLQYIDYCDQNGTFRTTKVPIPTKSQALADAEALRNSPAWKAAKWRWQQEKGTWGYIHRQAAHTPP